METISNISFEVNALPAIVINPEWIVEPHETIVNYIWNGRACKVALNGSLNMDGVNYVINGMNDKFHIENLCN